MKVITPGHVYKVDTLDGYAIDTIVYVQRVGEKYPGNEVAHPGTTMQEVARTQIDRLKYVNNQSPCPETEACIELLRKFIYTLESRAARIHNRVLMVDSHRIEDEPTCTVCGHINHVEGSCLH